MSRKDTGLAVIIPTKDRADDLRSLFKSMTDQDVWPAQVIIIEGGDAAVEKLIQEFSHFDISVSRFRPASLPAQRNAALPFLRDGIDIVAFFDDDILLEPGSVRLSLEAARRDGSVAGVSMNNISHPKGRFNLLESIFMVGSARVGILLPSGFHSKICSLDHDANTQWLLGGATFWKRDVFGAHRFDEWFCGYAHCEDVDFSYPLSKDRKLVALKDAKFIHNTKPIGGGSEYAMGKMQVANRVYFVRKHKEFSLALCYWACFGLALKNFLTGVFLRKPRYLDRCRGVVSGLSDSLRGIATRVGEGIKS